MTAKQADRLGSLIAIVMLLLLLAGALMYLDGKQDTCEASCQKQGKPGEISVNYASTVCYCVEANDDMTPHSTRHDD